MADAAGRQGASQRPRHGLFHTVYSQILGLSLLLTVVGLVMVLSASTLDSYVATGSFTSIFLRQGLFAVAGLIIMFGMSRIRLAAWRRWANVVYVATLGLQLLVFSPLGTTVGGNRNWLHIAGLSVQPSEALKFTMIIWIAHMLALKSQRLTSLRALMFPTLVGVGIGIGLVLLGHDMGTAMIMLIVMAGCLFYAGIPARFFVLLLVTGAGVAAIFLAGSANRLSRVTSWLQQGSCNDYLNGCWQIVHGRWALAAGGVFGVGLGNSSAKWAGLPAAENDFVFAIIGEELGLVGALCVIIVFLLLAWRMMRLMAMQQAVFPRVIVGGVLVWIVGQAFVNIAVVLGLLPVLGVPLPFISSGGTALVSSLAAIGLVLAIAKQTEVRPE